MERAMSAARRELYRPQFEKDACGVGFVARLRGEAGHDIVAHGLEMLTNLEHRGAVGANPTTGDGAGVLTQIPDEIFRADCPALPPPGQYGAAMLFLPKDEARQKQVWTRLEKSLADEKLTIVATRRAPVNSAAINDEVRQSEPAIWQWFVARPDGEDDDAFARRLFVARRMMEKAAADADFYCASFSARTIVYKGMFMARQLGEYYEDLRDGRFVSRFALAHQRYSTNTFPAWRLAHPYRFIAHNGEINTLRGNINNMQARRGAPSPAFGADWKKLWPVIEEGQSDTASLDNAVELLRLGGYSMAQTMLTLIPEAWQNNAAMPEPLRDFYRYHAPMMEPWDGPAEVVFADGRHIGAVLDRNGLRPGRFWLTDDGLMVMASEAGVLDVADEKIARKWRLQPGRILLADLEEGRLVEDEEIKQDLTQAHDYTNWVKRAQISLSTLSSKADGGNAARADEDSDAPSLGAPLELLRAFGYTAEDLKFLLRPMVEGGAEPVGSMGDDTPPATLSARARPLFSYFRQEFAQVTNPAIDPIREELVMSLGTYLGPRPNLMEVNAAPEKPLFALNSPLLLPEDMRALRDGENEINTRTLDITFAVDSDSKTNSQNDSDSQTENDAAQMEAAVEALCAQAVAAVEGGADVLILSDKNTAAARAPIPALLAVAAVHQRLIEAGLRARVGLAVETGAAREVHHFAVLAGFGAEAFYPYLALRAARTLRLHETESLSPQERMENYRRAVNKGLLKVMSKMGVSTFQSYCGAQIFEAVGLDEELARRYFGGVVSQIGGANLSDIAAGAMAWHRAAFNTGGGDYNGGVELEDGGDYALRTRGESHQWRPETVSRLQHAARANSGNDYEQFAAAANRESEAALALRGLLKLRAAKTPAPLDEVEPAANIVRRFSTGAMSFGSISREAHTTLAIAMNRIGGKSNTGEGGEEPDRFVPLENGDSMRSAIKQVASGRFGVTAEYLANSDMMQIKIAQGAKPGEGGQLPGHKVDEAIGRVRHSVPGVGLISPPPHHDIYSIEDIAQLIYDLKCANPQGQVSVKLVSRCGVGTVAAGVVKGRSDHVTIAGHDGGTGASPLSSIKHAGTPWELGLAETQQTLVKNGLRGRVSLQVDGQLKTGRDVIIGAILGADEFGFATAPLIAQGCIMMRKCHLNTCPVGIATQDPVLRKKFTGKPEHVVNYFFFVAEEVRKILALLGARRLDDIIGRVELLEPACEEAAKKTGARAAAKIRKLDLSRLLAKPAAGNALHQCETQNHHLEEALDAALMAKAEDALSGKKELQLQQKIKNSDRAVGAMLSNRVARAHGGGGLPDHTLRVDFDGVAGQSFGAFLARGITFVLSGEANDYLGKGLSGGIVAVRPPAAVRPPQSARGDGENIIAGNTLLYGATGGFCFLRGVVGERFAVRNSGAAAVIEGAGDHCCEYMTGGVVVSLGAVGRNFAAGMSGGVAYVLDEGGDGLADKLNAAAAAPEPLSSEPSPSGGASDEEVVQDLLRRHFEMTGSPKAERLLKDWETARQKFVKIMPHEYRRALMDIARRRERAA